MGRGIRGAEAGAPCHPTVPEAQRGRWLYGEGGLHEEWLSVCDEQEWGGNSASWPLGGERGKAALRPAGHLGLAEPRGASESLWILCLEFCVLRAEAGSSTVWVSVIRAVLSGLLYTMSLSHLTPIAPSLK